MHTHTHTHTQKAIFQSADEDGNGFLDMDETNALVALTEGDGTDSVCKIKIPYRCGSKLICYNEHILQILDCTVVTYKSKGLYVV